jgi:hypothetical protein
MSTNSLGDEYDSEAYDTPPGEAYREIIRDKDAEIARLKAELDSSRKLCQIWIDKSARQDSLITKLCAALEESDPFDRDDAYDLLQRARREATQ